MPGICQEILAKWCASLQEIFLYDSEMAQSRMSAGFHGSRTGSGRIPHIDLQNKACKIEWSYAHAGLGVGQTIAKRWRFTCVRS